MKGVEMRSKFFTLIAILMAFTCSFTLADDKNRRSDKSTWVEPQETGIILRAPYNYNPEPSVFIISLDPGHSGDSYIIGPEIPTLISGFYDYKTNGEANHYIQVDPTNPLNLHAVDVTADSLDFAGATSRRTYYAVSADGGDSWALFDQVPGIRSGYPVLKVREGAAVISNHSLTNGVVNTNLYVDIAPLAGAFNQYVATDPFSIWPQIEVLSNGNVGILSRPQHPAGSDFDTVFYQNWNGSVLGPKSVAYVTTPPYIGTVGSNCRFNIAQNSAGRITQVFNGVLEDDTLANSKVWSRTSVDNGANWGPLEVVFLPFIENGVDTVGVAGGSDLVYKPNTNTWVYSMAATANGLFEKGRLYLIKSDGSRSVITTAAEVGATTEFALTMSFVFNLDQPALAYSADGLVLYCVYSVVTTNLGSSGYNSRDVFYQRSLDDGTTWSPPIRITNTPDIDECYPSISNWNKGTSATSYELNFTYMKDPGVGPASFGGSAPPSRNHQIYRKITEANIIGISNSATSLDGYQLNQNYPNPFNPSTTISYNLVKNSFVSLKVFDVLGKEVVTLVNENQQPGLKNVNFNASNYQSGIYFYTITTGDFTDTKKMILVK